jgi:hypothetical protein
MRGSHTSYDRSIRRQSGHIRGITRRFSYSLSPIIYSMSIDVEIQKNKTQYTLKFTVEHKTLGSVAIRAYLF